MRQTAAALCVDSRLFSGPVARAFGGIDLSLPVGMLLSAAVYLTMTHARRADRTAR